MSGAAGRRTYSSGGGLERARRRAARRFVLVRSYCPAAWKIAPFNEWRHLFGYNNPTRTDNEPQHHNQASRTGG